MSSTKAEPLRDEGTRAQVVLAGAISGLVSRFCIAPLDVLKIRLQLQYHSLSNPLSTGPHHPPPSTRVPHLARHILLTEGLTAFWKGNIPAEILYLSYGAIQFLSYRTTTQFLDNTSLPYSLPGSVTSFVSGAVAGTAATTATYPLDLLRTRFAAQGTERVYEGLVGSVRDITRHEGLGGFFRGLSAGVAQIVPYMGLFFAMYEGLRGPMGEVQLPFGSGDAVAGVAASVLSKSAVFPLDTVRKRLQVQGPTRARYIGGSRIPVYEKGMVGTVGMILRREGARGLYRGLGVSLIKAAPSSAVTMWTYERVMRAIKVVEED